MKASIILIISLIFTGFALGQNKYEQSNGKCHIDDPTPFDSNINKTTPEDFIINNKEASGTVQKRPLHEVFTSSTCGYCPAANTKIDGIVLSSSNFHRGTLIKYQVSWPGAGDPYTTPEVNTRRLYYNVTGVPDFYVDANQETGTAYSQTKFNNYANQPAYFEIEATHTIVGSEITVDITITPYMNWTGKCRVAVVEKTTYGNVGSNGETEFHHVMMKMLPNPGGTTVSLTNGTDFSYSVSGDLSSTFIEEIWDLEVVVFLQQDSDKEVMQSNYSVFIPTATDLILSNLNVTNTYTECSLSTEEQASVEIFNFGPEELQNTAASLYVNNQLIAEEIITDNIPAMGSIVYTFAQTLDLSPEGAYTIEAAISHPSDIESGNNMTQTNATSGNEVLQVVVKCDNYPAETSWKITDNVNGQVIASGGNYTTPGQLSTTNVCILSHHCYTFTIYDGYGDGICCSYGSGYYEIIRDGQTIVNGASFTSSKSHAIGAILDVDNDDIAICVGEEINWDINGVGTFTHLPEQIDNTMIGTTNVTYTINDGTTCQLADNFSVSVFDSNLDISLSDIQLCAGQLLQLPEGYGNYLPSAIDNSVPQTTTVTYTINESMSCENSASFLLTIFPKPEIDIVCDNLSSCLNLPITLPEATGIYSPASIDHTTASNTQVTYYTQPNEYGCVDSCMFNVEIYDLIDINPQDIVICQGQQFEFQEAVNGNYNPEIVSHLIPGTTNVTYTVAEGTECERSVDFNVIVNVLPDIDIDCENRLFCINDPISLPEGNGIFYPEDIESSVSGITNVLYTTAMNEYGCTSNCSFEVQIVNNEIDIVPENITICQGEPLIYPEGNNGIFIPADLTSDNAYSTNVLYIVGDHTHCMQSVLFSVQVFATPTATITRSNGNILNAISNGYVQWYFNGEPIENANGSSLLCLADGEYYFIASSQHGCTRQSSSIVMSNTGINQNNDDLISIFPNPAIDAFYIYNAENAYVSLYNILGECLLTIPKAEKSQAVSTINFVAGTYFIRIQHNDSLFIEKIVITK